MKVILFGGTGWLGHNIAKILASKNIDVTIVTRGKKQTFAGEVAGIRSIIADKKDESAMREIFQTRYTHVIDTVPTVESIDLIAKYGTAVRHYIHCSSTGGYTPLPFIPCDETARYGGFDNGTGWDRKRIFDNKVLELFLNKGFPATVIRPCYITGEGMLPLDNFGDRRADFIPDLIAEKPIVLPEGGNALLQPIHVKDLAQSFYLALMHPETAMGQVYNICLSHAVTLNRYVELNAAAFGKKPNVSYMSVDEILKTFPDVSEVDLRFVVCHMCFSIEKAKRDLEYKPFYTPEEAIEETAFWAAKQAGL